MEIGTRRESFAGLGRKAAASMLILSCTALYGITWSRSTRTNASIEDAVRLLNTSSKDDEREQALGVIAQQMKNLAATVAEAAKCEGKIGEYARAHLDAMQRRTAAVRK